MYSWGAWVARSVKRLTLQPQSGSRGCEFKPCIGFCARHGAHFKKKKGGISFIYWVVYLYPWWTHWYLFYSVHCGPLLSSFIVLLTLPRICPFGMLPGGPCVFAGYDHPLLSISLFSAPTRGPKLVPYFSCPTVEPAMSPRSPASSMRAILQMPRSDVTGIQVLLTAFEQREYLAACAPSQWPAPGHLPQPERQGDPEISSLLQWAGNNAINT